VEGASPSLQDAIKGKRDIMLQTLPFVLFIVMVEVSVGAVSVLVFLDWRNEVKRGFLTSYAFIYLVLAGLTYWFQQSFATPKLLNLYTEVDKSWTGVLSWPLLLFFLLLLPYGLFLILDKTAGVDEQKKAAAEAVSNGEGARRSSPFRLLRLISGGVTVVVGLLTLFIIGMIFRSLGGSALGQGLTVVSFFAAAFALGGVMTAMWLGHWYLVTPALSQRPLLFATTVVLVAILAEAVLALLIGPSALFGSPVLAAHSTPHNTSVVATPTPVPPTTSGTQVKPIGAPQMAPLSVDAIGWIRIVVGFFMTFVLGGLAWKLVHDRSFQSATGMLYLVVVCALSGEALARGLFLVHL
jgi:DMSO reductase anchor subunit